MNLKKETMIKLKTATLLLVFACTFSVFVIAVPRLEKIIM